MKKFDLNDKLLRNQYDDISWVKNSGVSEDELKAFYNRLIKQDNGENRATIKAKLFAYHCENSRYAIDKNDIFQEKLFDCNLIYILRDIWLADVKKDFIPNIAKDILAINDCGAGFAIADFGHTSPNSELLLKLGFSGLLLRAENAEKVPSLTDKQREYYNSIKIVLNACITFVLRLADGVAPFNKDNEKALRQIAKGAPTNIYEAMQLLIVYFFLHEYVYKTRVRTLGRLDVLLYPFYKKDIENGVFSKDDVKEMLKFFLNKFSAAKVPYGLPFCLSGLDNNGNDFTCELSYLIVEAYEQLDIYSPKIHIRVSDKSPKEFIKLVLSSIRKGKNSFVFCNDNVATLALQGVGIDKTDSINYVPIGCYEPAVWGKELGCTGNSAVNLAKALEFVLLDGFDYKTNLRIGVKPKKIDTFDDFYCEIKNQIKFLTNKCIDFVVSIEKYYEKINPDSLLSCMYDRSVELGVDVYGGGATYNNSSLMFFSIATLVDSLTSIKKFVYDEKLLSLEQFIGVLKNNWKGYEKLRLRALKMPEKYGNENDTADYFTKDITDFCASLVNNVPNARGGVFKASLFSIDHCYDYGKKVMATPDGRFEGDSLSKNLCASWAMDKNGVLALINSVTKIDHSKFSNGSVLDLVLHPSAIANDDGLDAFYWLLITYFKKGGFAMHANVFDVDDLRSAQKYPERYATLQVRLCGWNAYFVALRKEEQESFILQADNVK